MLCSGVVVVVIIVDIHKTFIAQTHKIFFMSIYLVLPLLHDDDDDDDDSVQHTVHEKAKQAK